MPDTMMHHTPEFNAAPFRVGGGTAAPEAPRVLLYSHDTFGLGHLRRNLAIAERMLAPDIGWDVWLASGSPVIRDWDLPPGLRVQPLPPVVKTGSERYAAHSGTVPFPLVKGLREALILQTALRERPGVVLVDHAPAGMRQELLPLLAAARGQLPQTRLVLGLRDIIDSPDVVRRLWAEEDVYGLLAHAYHRILVYGTRDVFDVADAYALPPAVAAKLRYVGYVARPPAPLAGAPWPGRVAGVGMRVLVTAGGGGDGQALMQASLAALATLPPGATDTVLVAGPLMPPDQAAALAAAAAARPDVTVLPHTNDLRGLLGQADLVVSMGGYNTTVEILAARVPAVIVPRSEPRMEQLLRARLLEQRGLLVMAEPGPGLVGRLAALLPRALEHARSARPAPLELDGAARAVEALGEFLPIAGTAAQPRRRIGYVMKRYPRLSETFILNEIAGMEALGEELEIFSLLPPEPPPHHPLVASVRAPVNPPPGFTGLLRAHRAALAARPLGYAQALGQALRLLVSGMAPLSVGRQFARAGFVADTARRHGLTHLHAHFANAPTAVAHLAGLMAGLPFSFTTHAKDLYLTAPRVLAGRVRAAQFVATCTHYNVAHLRGLLPGCDQDKLALVYHGIDLARFGYRAPGYAFQADGTAPLVLAVARLVPKKGLDDLIAACALLAARGVKLRLRIVGSGPLRDELTADIAARGLEEMVSLDGAMTQDQLIGLFARADLFALVPRITEDGDRDGIPNVLAEAMASGVPVVTSAVSGIPELVAHERTGLLVPPQDPAALAEAMARVLADPALGRRLAAAARERLEQHFDCQTNTRAFRALFPRFVCEVVPAPATLPAPALA